MTTGEKREFFDFFDEEILPQWDVIEESCRKAGILDEWEDVRDGLRDFRDLVREVLSTIEED